MLEAVVERSGEPVRTNFTFADPLTTDRPSGSAAPTPAPLVQLHASNPVTASTALQQPLFAAYQTLDDSPSVVRQALRQVNLVMEQVKVMHEASQVAYNASTALQTNVHVSKTPTRFLNVELYPTNHWVVALHRDQEIFDSTRLELGLNKLSEPVGAR